MDETLTFKYDRIADILYISKIPRIIVLSGEEVERKGVPSGCRIRV
jgi:hypothetical protein